jgi:hypothetical protein
MADLLIDWSEVDRFLQLLGRSADSVDALLFPPKEGPGSDKGAKKLKLDKAGRQSVEQFLAMPLYQFHSLGIRPNPGGAKAAEITAGIALWFEADGGLPLEAQEALPELLGMPEPTVSVWSAHRSLHCYWVAEEDQGLPPAQWKKAQERLIAAVKAVSPEAGVDEAIKDPSRVMRAAGGIHPATGERARIHSEGGKRYDLAALVELLKKEESGDIERLNTNGRIVFNPFMGPYNQCPKGSREYHEAWSRSVQSAFDRTMFAHPEELAQLLVRGINEGYIPWEHWPKEAKGDPHKYFQLVCGKPWEYIRQVIIGQAGEEGEEWVRVIDEAMGHQPKNKPTPSAKSGDDETKALSALAFIPPRDFLSYDKWLSVGMALHSVSEELLPSWIDWSRGMGEAFNEGECCAKWQSFSGDREGGLGIGSLIRLAQKYGYRPETSSAESKDRGLATADTSSRFTAGVSGVSGVSGVEGKSVRTLSVQERMRILRDRAEELVEDEATPLLDRLPVMRDEASKLDLPTRDSDLQKILWGARRALAAPAEAITTGGLLDFTPIPWCWEGLLMREAINLLIAAPKVGKTSLLIEAIASWHRGEAFLGKQFHGGCPPVLIVGSDQPQSDWGRMLQKVGLVSEERRLLAPIVGLFHSGTPLSLDPEGIEKIAAYAKEHPGLLVVIDSYARCVASLGLSERDAEIAGPLADLQEAVAPYGATIVGIHHANKGGHESASMASRGSSALPALASQLIHLTRLEQGQEGSMGGKRMLTTEGRGGAPEKMLLELSEEGRWLFRGDGDALLQEQERQRTIGALNDRQASALEHVEETWEASEGRIGLSATVLASLMELRGADPSRVARRLLEQLRERGLVRRKVVNLGMGAGGLSTQYVPATADTFTATPDTPDTPDTPAVKREEVSDRSEAPSMDSKDAEVGEFESVQTFQNGQWSNGWMVEKCTKTLAGTFFSLFREDDPSQVASLHQSFVRPCAS